MGVNIIFIGNVGVGKTTTICNALNLLKSNVPILDVGAGNTTLCEVNITKKCNIKTSINVIPYSFFEFRFLLKMLFKNNSLISRELQFALKNLINIGDVYGKKSFEEKIKEFKNESDFISFGRINSRYTNRNTKVLEYTNDEVDVLDWLKINFNKINTGKHELIGLPKSIKIHINKSDIPDDLEWNQIDYMIDTKGIDYQFKKNYLDNSFKEVYCSSFGSGPENNLIEFVRKSNNNKNNKFILINIKYDEPNHVNGADGNYDIGLKLKLEEFYRLTSEIINRANIFCFDSNQKDLSLSNFINTKILNN